MLPQELLDLIIGHLDGDMPSLKSCALTSTAFRPSSQKGIFSRIYVSSSSFHGHTFENLYTLLTTSPHIAPLITSFELSLHHQSDEIEFEKIPLFLPLLCNVHRFFLLSATNLMFQWNYLPVRVQKSLVAFWHASNIIDLRIEAMGCMELDEGSRLRIGRWSSLKHLSILWSHPERLWESNDWGSLPPPQLESLTIGYFNLNLIKHAGLDISILRRFSVALEIEEDASTVPAIQDLLAQFQNTLEYLHLEMILRSQPFHASSHPIFDLHIIVTAIAFQMRHNYFDLYQCRNLRVVHIGIDMPQDFFPIGRLSPSVQEITIEVTVSPQIHPDCCKWSVIDSSIGLQDLPSLFLVKLCIHVSRDTNCSLAICECDDDGSVDDVWEEAKARNSMPILYSKGILRVYTKSSE